MHWKYWYTKWIKEILDKILNSLGIDKNLIDSCSSIILNCLEKDDENEINNKEEINENKNDILDINSQLEITRNDSDTSFCEELTFSYITPIIWANFTIF